MTHPRPTAQAIIWTLALVLVGTIPFLARSHTRVADRPLPALDDFVREFRRGLKGNQEALATYRYHQTVTKFDRDADGTVKDTSTSVYDARPSMWGSPIDRVLIEEDGKPIPADKLAKQRAERRREALEYQRRLDRETPRERRERLDREAKRRRETDKKIADAFSVSEARMVGREMFNGHSTIVLDFSARPGVDPTTDVGKVLSKAAGRVWITEDTHQLVRLEVAAVETISYGWGVIVRLHPGTKLVIERRFVSGEVWLPSFYRLTGSMRMLLVKPRRFDTLSEFSRYRKIGTPPGDSAREAWSVQQDGEAPVEQSRRRPL